MALSRSMLSALGAALFLGHNVAAVPLDIGLDICIPFGIEVGLFIDLFEPPQVTEAVPVFATSTTTLTAAGTYTVPAGISSTAVTAQSATELCVSSVTTKTTTYPCSTSTSFPTTWWNPCKGRTTSATCTWTPPITVGHSTVTRTVTATVTESATPCSATSTSTSTPHLTTGKATQIATGIGNNIAINALGYNVLDNYMYAYQAETNKILRIGADGTSVILDTDTPVEGSYIGDIDTRGRYWMARGPIGNWGVFGLAPDSPTFGKQLANGTASPPGDYDVADWVYVPSAGEYLYAVGSITSTNETALLRFGMDSHKWETVAEYGPLGVVAVGAMYGMSNGTLYASLNHNGQIWQFPLSGDKPFFVSQGPAAGGADGARCVLNLLGH